MTAGASTRLRTLIVNPVGDLGGAELYLLQMLDATDRLDVSAVLLGDGPLRGELERRSIPVSVLPVGRRVLDLARGVNHLRRVLAHSDADVVLTNGLKAQAVAGVAAWFMGIPSVWIKHDHSYDRTLAAPLARIATRVVATADAVADAVERHDVTLVPPPKPQPPLPRSVTRAQLQELGMEWAPDSRYLVMITRLTPYKGVDVAIEALTEAPGWNLVVMGTADQTTPDEMDRLMALAARLGVANRVTFLGYVAHGSRLLTAFDALAVLTRSAGRRTPGREGFGMSAMEAMVAGLPVVAPDDGGSVARRTRDGAGYLVDATDPGSVAQALCHLRSDAVRKDMGDEATARSSQFESIDVLARRLVTVMASAARRPGAGRASRDSLSVVSPVLNEIAVLDRLVPSVLAQLREDDEFVVVDSGSTDGTRARLSEWSQHDKRLRLVEVDPCSIGASRNHGVAAARHELIACTDAGCQPDEDWLERLREAITNEANPDMITGTFRAATRPGRLFEMAMAAVSWPDPEELRRSPLPVRLWLNTFGPRFDARRADGRSLAFRKQSFLRVGGFPDDLLTAEDEAFGRAMLAMGARCELVGDATVTWWQRESVSAAFRQFRGYGRGGGNSGSLFLLAKDATRAAVYVGLLGMLARRRAVDKAIGIAGLGAIFVFPAHRVIRREQSPMALLLLPFAQGVKDGGKLIGVFEGLVLRRRGTLPHGNVGGRER